MNDAMQWADLDGEPPEKIRKLLEAGRDVPDMPPAQADRMERSFFAARAVQHRSREPPRTLSSVADPRLVAGLRRPR